MPMNLKTLLKHIFIYSAGAVFYQLINIIATKTYTNVFSVEDFGMISYVLTFTALLSTALSGIQISSALGRFYTDKQFAEQKKTVFATCFFTLLFFSTATFILSGTLFFPLRHVLFPKIQNSAVFILIFVFCFVSTQEKFLALFFKWDLKPNVYIIFYNLSPLASLLLVIIMSSFLSSAVTGFMSGITGGSLLIFLLLLFLLKKRLSLAFDKDWSRKVIRFSLPLIPYTSTLLVLTFVDRFLIRLFIGYEAVAVYSIGAKISAVISAVSAGFRNAWGPYFYTTYSDENSGHNFARVFDLFNFFAVGTMLVITLFSRQFILLISSEKYLGAIQIVPFLIVSNIVFNLQYFLLGIYIKNKTIYLTYTALTGIAVNIVLDIFLIPRYQLLGAAFATMLSFSVMFFINLLLSQRLHKIPYRIKFNLLSFLPWIAFCLLWNRLIFFDSPALKIVLIFLYVFVNNLTGVFSFRYAVQKIRYYIKQK